jgi:hypothetical protein
VSVTFYNGVYDDPVTIYRPCVMYNADVGVWADKLGPLQTSGCQIYSVSNCVQIIEHGTIYWMGCYGRVPDDDSGDCPESHG